jgi:hypothetical protein
MSDSEKWISLGEEFPPPWPVLARTPRGDYAVVELDGNEWLMSDIMSEVRSVYSRDTFTHWMPLPEPPMKATDE